MMQNTEFTIKFNICLDQFEELSVYNYLKLTDSDSDGPIVHGDQSTVEGKSFLFGSKSSNGEKCFNFQAIYRNNIS